MRRSVLVLGLLALAMAACGRGPQPPVAVVPAASTTGPVAGLPLVGVRIGGLTPGLQDPAGTPEARPGTVTDAEAQQKYDTALAEGVSLVADRKWADAVAAFETALSFKNDDGVAQAVKKLKSRIEQESAAERITADIQAILNDGQAEDAAKLATDALQQFGTTAAAAQLTNLSQQANALTAVQGDGKDGRLAKAKEEYEAAIKDKNSRAAALALEQALQNGGGDDLKPKLDEIRTTLTKFEELRARAAELRKDPAQLEDAETALNQAAELGGAAAVQQDLDDVQFAIQNRRERLAVAEFELRGDVGVPQAGAFVADEILTAFKGKYDLVERGQLDKLVAELKLENGLTDDDLARQKVGQAAKVRYLVVGSVTPIAGITVQARLVDTKTGLIVQTAKITAANQDELIQRLPQLGQVLAMTDEQKRDFEQQQMKDVPPIAVEVLKPDPEMALPPPPELPGEVPPPPIMPARLKPPAQPANLQPAQFANLPPPPPDGQAFPSSSCPWRKRSCSAAGLRSCLWSWATTCSAEAGSAKHSFSLNSA